MASLQQRGGWFHLQFRYQGRQYSHALKTKDRREAEAHRGTVDRLLIRIRNKEVLPPSPEVDLPTFLLSGGKFVADEAPLPQMLTLGDLRDRYLQTHANGTLEPKTIVMAKIHFRHLFRHLEERSPALKLTPDLLQQYVQKRTEAKGKKGERISPVTIQKDIATLRAAWNLAVRSEAITGSFPGRYLTYPKYDEKPGFQTMGEIERKIARGGLTLSEIDDLWAGLFLTQVELAEFLEFARTKATVPHLFPMLAFAAHTGARRSELMRMRIDDVDLDAGTAIIREKKKSRGKRTTRRVPVSGFLKSALQTWLAQHPGGQMMFCWLKGPANQPEPLRPMMAYEQFRKLVRGTKWDVLKGWHVLRHSFISICAAESVDQRVLQSWVGHLSAATHKRYTHLIPSREQEIISSVFR
jgi:integrase